MKTRAQKRRIGERDVWSLIVKCDDICFQHILPRLNSNDVKFLYEVNTETRKLIKRSSRAGDLKKKFKVRRDVVDIDFGVVWEHISLWPSTWKTNQISARKLLKRINSSCSSGRERRKSVGGMNGRLDAAAEQGNLEMVKYCVANECPIDEWACASAAIDGHLECLKYLREEVKAPWDLGTATLAAENGHLHILEYLVERKYDKYDELACELAARTATWTV